jgi:hypothetical protein
MGELSFLTIIVSLAVCSILVFAVYQYMKVRFTILEQSQKEQALILQQYIEESSYDIQGLQSIVLRQPTTQGNNHVSMSHQQENELRVYNVEELYDNEDHNKHILMDTVMYEAPNKQRNALIAISSDSEDTESDSASDSESDGESSDSDGESSESSDSDSESASDGESDGESSESDGEIDSAGDDVKRIEISIPSNDNPSYENTPVPAPITDELSETATQDIKTVTVDLGVTVPLFSPGVETDTIDVLSLLQEHSVHPDDDEEPAHETTTGETGAANAPGSTTTATTTTTATMTANTPSSTFSGLSVVELRALLKERYKGQPDKITNLNKLKKPELLQLLQE